MKAAFGTKSVSGLAALSGFTSLIAMASCCFIPMALAVAGLSGVSGIFLFGGEHHFIITAISFVVILAGWALYGWEQWQCAKSRCEPPSRTSLYLLSLATALFALALLFGPFIEPTALAELRQWRR